VNLIECGLKQLSFEAVARVLSVMTNFLVLLTRLNDYLTVLCIQNFKNTLLETIIDKHQNTHFFTFNTVLV